MSIQCPKCQSTVCKKNGFTRHGKQNHQCLECGKQFSLEPFEPGYAKIEKKEKERILLEIVE